MQIKSSVHRVQNVGANVMGREFVASQCGEVIEEFCVNEDVVGFYVGAQRPAPEKCCGDKSQVTFPTKCQAMSDIPLARQFDGLTASSQCGYSLNRFRNSSAGGVTHANVNIRPCSSGIRPAKQLP